MNKAILMGRLVDAPIIRYSGTGNAIAHYTLAVDRIEKRDEGPSADFIRCVAFGKMANVAETYFYKGIKILITGRIQTGSYTNREGQTVYTTEIVVESQEFAEGRTTSTQTTSAASSVPDNDFCIPDELDEELPFN